MPVYQTEKDKKNEGKIIRVISDATGWCGHKLPSFYPLDAIFVRPSGSIGFAAECKARLVTYKQYPGVFLDATKVVFGRSWASEFANLDWGFAVGTTDGDVYVWKDRGEQLPIIWAGRTRQTRDENDIEPVVDIPWDLFKYVGRTEFL